MQHPWGHRSRNASGVIIARLALPALQRLATQTLAPTPPSFATMKLRAEFARRQELRARGAPLQTYLPAALAVVLLVGLFWWHGAPPQDVVRQSIDLRPARREFSRAALALPSSSHSQ